MNKPETRALEVFGGFLVVVFLVLMFVGIWSGFPVLLRKVIATDVILILAVMLWDS